MNQQPIKRRNPFDEPRGFEEQLSEEKANIEEVIEEVEPQKPSQTNSYTARSTQRQPKQVVRQQYYEPIDVNREKYTSTMDVTLRRQIKIACATRGIMFAKFVEDACREKLQREGGR